MAIDASRAGDRCTRDGDHSIPGWRSRKAIDTSRSMHPGMAIDAPGKTIAATLDGDHFIPGWHPGIEIDASRDGDRRDGIPGMVIRHPGMAIDASRDGNQCIPWIDIDRCILGWRSQHPRMAIARAASLDAWRSMHPWMAIDASRDGDRCIAGSMASNHPEMSIDASLVGDQSSQDDYRCIT